MAALVSPSMQRAAKARSLGYEVISALCDRGGFDDLFGNIDSGTKREIAHEIGEIALKGAETK